MQEFTKGEWKHSKSLSAHSDHELVELALSTEDSVYYGELYDRYAHKVYGKCILMIRDLNYAHDLTHDIIVKAFLKLRKFQGRSKFSTWLFQICYTHCIDHIRRSGRLQFDELEEASMELQVRANHEVEIQSYYLYDLKLDVLEDVINELPPDERELILMKYQDKLSIVDLARRFETSSSAMKMRLKRCRDRMKHRYDQLLLERQEHRMNYVVRSGDGTVNECGELSTPLGSAPSYMGSGTRRNIPPWKIQLSNVMEWMRRTSCVSMLGYSEDPSNQKGDMPAGQPELPRGMRDRVFTHVGHLKWFNILFGPYDF